MFYTAAKDPCEFITTPEKLREILSRYGVAVIPSVLNAAEVEQFRNGAWDYIEHATSAMETPVQRGDPLTWKSFYNLGSKRGMLLQHYGVGQAQFLWDLRQNPKIVSIFETFWGTSDLLVSFDGTSIALPHETTNKGHFVGKHMYHLDQRLSLPTFQCMQSWVTAYDVNPGDATLSVLEGSHKFFQEFAKLHSDESAKGRRKDWYVLKDTEVECYISKGCMMRDITCPAGSMVFWDSRTVHYGKPAMKNRPTRNYRTVAYLCYLPTSTVAAPRDLEQKRQAFAGRKTTSHWPNRGEAFAQKPRFGGRDDVQCPPEPVLSPLGRRLAGLPAFRESIDTSSTIHDDTACD